MNRIFRKCMAAFMIMIFIVFQLCGGIFAEESMDVPAAEEPAPVVEEPAPVESPSEEQPPAEEPVEQASEPEPVVEPTAPAEPVTQETQTTPAAEEPAPLTVPAEPTQPMETTTAPAAQGEYDVEGIDQSELESYLYELGMGEYADSITDGTNGTGSYTWGLNTLTREPAELKGVNFVVFGLSGENSGDDGRSDTIIICTIDPDRKEIKLTSILRDTKAAIEGHEPQKINAALKLGGTQLALDTLNKNFGLTLKDSVTVQFDTLIEVIDILGGIELELNQDEADFINEYSVIYGFEPLTAGVQLLNGWQSSLYCRIRKIDSDKVRAGRQQLVIQKIFEKMKDSGFIQWLQIVMKALETSKISMPLGTIMEVISLPLNEYTLVKNVIPDIDHETDLKTAIDEHGEWVWLYDLGKAGDRIVDIINNQ